MRHTALLRDLLALLPAADILTGTDAVHYAADQSRAVAGAPLAVVFPRNHQAIVELLGWANRQRVNLVPSGGRTGLGGGACAGEGDVVVSLARMDRLLSFDRQLGEISVEAGVTIARLQQLAADAGWFYPVDYASRDTAQIGGALATNAGGIRVLRYGMTRDQVLGLTAVTGSGQTLAIDRNLVKDNAGYDLKHLLIGSEGTLAIISSVTLKLQRPLPLQATVLAAFADMPALLAAFCRLRQSVSLNAAEFFCHQSLLAVCRDKGITSPFDQPSAFYLLLDFDRQSLTDEQLAACLADAGQVLLAAGGQQASRLWQLREGISASIRHLQPCKQDIACHLSQLGSFCEAVQRQCRDVHLLLFGHLGDGNVHVNILPPAQLDPAGIAAWQDSLALQLASLVAQHHGSVSAEHGIGLLKTSLISYSRSDVELQFYRQIKQLFDPAGILNRGKLLP